MEQKANLGHSLLSLLIRHLSPCPGFIHSLGPISIMINSKDSHIHFPGFCLFPIDTLWRQDLDVGYQPERSLLLLTLSQISIFSQPFLWEQDKLASALSSGLCHPTRTLVLSGNASGTRVTLSAAFSWFPWSVGLSHVLIKQTLEYHHFTSGRWVMVCLKRKKKKGTIKNIFLGILLWHSRLKTSIVTAVARAAALAQVWSLAQEFPHATGAAKRKNNFFFFLNLARAHSQFHFPPCVRAGL